MYFIKPMTNPTKMPIAVPYSIPTPELFSKNILENITPIDGPIAVPIKMYFDIKSSFFFSS